MKNSFEEEEILEEIWEIVQNPAIKCGSALEEITKILEEYFDEEVEPDIDDPDEEDVKLCLRR